MFMPEELQTILLGCWYPEARHVHALHVQLLVLQLQMCNSSANAEDRGETAQIRCPQLQQVPVVKAIQACPKQARV